jgi:HD-GYP domain-containing protein (c-di-GMP phosphodiesterase class II)
MRLLALADVYEALTSERPYRRAMSSDEALAIIRADVPARLDADAFSVLDQVLADEPGAAERLAAGRVQATLHPDSS